MAIVATKVVTPTPENWANPELGYMKCVEGDPYFGGTKIINRDKFRGCVGSWLEHAGMVDKTVFLSKYAVTPLLVVGLLTAAVGVGIGYGIGKKRKS